MKKTVRREELALLVCNLMKGEVGDEIRRRIRQVKETAERAVEEGGSSHNLDKLLNQICIKRQFSNRPLELGKLN